MSFLIIDSSKNYAKKLYEALSGNGANADKNVIDSSKEKDFSALSKKIAARAKNRRTILLINAEALIEGGLRQHQKLVELVFWLRCKHKLQNAIIFYSLQSINRLLKTKPENFILLAPSSYHFQQPLDIEKIKKLQFEPLGKSDNLKPFLKSRINLRQTRHRYANYAGMSLMLNIAKEVWNVAVDTKIIQGNVNNFTQFFGFRKSLDYHLLATYFDLEIIGIDEAKKTSLKIANQLSRSKRILLIDDLAENGWKPILSKMIYGNPNNKNIKSLRIHNELQNGKRLFDLDKTKKELEATIKTHKPHLILLDLRLNDEEGKRPSKDLGGFKLLKYLKSHSSFKGVPVIIFTASSNAEITKEMVSAGAEAVWTKPGLDEGLGSLSIYDRYQSLLKAIEKAFDKYKNLTYYGGSNQFSDLRIQLLNKIEWVKYRLMLYEEPELMTLQQATAFKDFTDIYVDTNFLMANSGIDIVENLSNLYVISKMTSRTQKYYSHNQKTFPYYEPKIVISNQIFDELIKKIKTMGEPMNVLVYSIIRELFPESVRTEYRLFNNDPNLKPQFELRNPKEDLYADPFIIDDISHLIVLRYKKFKVGNNRYATVNFPNRKVLLISNDGDLIKKTRLMFKSSFKQYTIADFNNEARKIKL